ncbi:cyclophilin-like fold protein [Hymenobacter weizhouensis]|uniref:cyclophilin-like fold protein n=1 Tax=Hymenobacter sp. YIM 151500-1 TaxID=2987689 RepID=UPI0022263A7F|nr:cyclophilin-like fold protein [Hymenobacter sp. YIM 151500-1]UYZ64466.1 cyclophilin-like fold protein [Hymenobacter sp. YIM 151500-1]
MAQNTSNTAPGAASTISNRLRIRIGSTAFTATLLDNPTAAAFKARLPLTVSMTELNGNEKYYDLPASLPTNATSPGTIQTGDLMLYGSTTLVLFYQPFATRYHYTRLGRIDNPAGLAAALGAKNVTVTFELQ